MTKAHSAGRGLCGGGRESERGRGGGDSGGKAGDGDGDAAGEAVERRCSDGDGGAGGSGGEEERCGRGREGEVGRGLWSGVATARDQQRDNCKSGEDAEHFGERVHGSGPSPRRVQLYRGEKARVSQSCRLAVEDEETMSFAKASSCRATFGFRARLDKIEWFSGGVSCDLGWLEWLQQY